MRCCVGALIHDGDGRVFVHRRGWDWTPGEPDAGRREFDFLVEVEGDLDAPRLEHPKHVEGAWIEDASLDRLTEGRVDGDDGIRDVVTRALEHLRGR